jgi:ornithine cyclodeaminase/alanine dehydrogenase-like protein (mu-crystallin family)
MSDLLILGKSDISKITVPASLVIDLVEKAVAGIGLGTSTNPPKVSIAPVEKSMTVAMLAHVKDNRALGMKAYTEFPIGAGKTKVGSVITLFDETSGRPIAFMDCEWITAIRTAAVTALFAREAVHSDTRMALVIGAGAQGREAIPALIHAWPEVREISILAPRREAVEALIGDHAQLLDGRVARYCTDLASDTARADLVVGAAGPGAHPLAAPRRSSSATALLPTCCTTRTACLRPTKRKCTPPGEISWMLKVGSRASMRNWQIS